jgi:two-component system sensor histidine kinase/response regulator
VTSPPRQLGHLLVVDDSQSNRALLALERIAERAYDVVLLDVVMPEMSGVELLTWLRRKHSAADLPIVMVTARDASEDVVESLRLGANDYVTKPIDFPVLLARLQTQISLRRLSQRKDEFLRIASHDLKNPLTVIMGVAEMLRRIIPPGTPLGPEHLEMLTMIAVRAHAMQRIIVDYLDFQALEDGELAITTSLSDLNAIASEIVQAQRPSAESKGVALRFEPDAELPPALLDPVRIGQVIENLVSNAVKFCPKGASVTARTRLCDGVRFEVRDTGPGLTPEDREKLFVKYARLSNRPTAGEKSSGLGLAICKQLIEAHGGAIGAEQNPEGGATFWFRVNPGAPSR